MKNIISLLFISLLASSFIIGCGSSDSDGGSSDGSGKTVNAPGSSAALSTDIASKGDTNKPKVTPACESGNPVPGCS